MAVPKGWKDTFIAALRDSGNVRASCQTAGVDRVTAYRWRKRSSQFAERWDVALQDAMDLLEGDAWQRARSHSDKLLILLLQAHRPELYRQPTTTVGVAPEIMAVLERLAELREQRRHDDE